MAIARERETDEIPRLKSSKGRKVSECGRPLLEVLLCQKHSNPHAGDTIGGFDGPSHVIMAGKITAPSSSDVSIGFIFFNGNTGTRIR